MMWWDDGGTSMWWLAPLTVLAFLAMAVVVGVVVWAARSSDRTPGPVTPRPPVGDPTDATGRQARELLDLRLARGDIDPEDYRARRGLLDDLPPVRRTDLTP